MSELQKEFLNFALIVAAAGAVLAAVWFLGRPAWQRWRTQQALQQSVLLAERQDYRGSILALRRATESAPLDTATWRETARRLAEIGSPQSVVAHENLVRLAPDDMALRLALVGEALRFGQVETADAALGGIEEAARADAAFHRLAAALALATGEADRLVTHLEALLAADPDDATARFNLAAIRLWDADPARHTRALADLEALVAVPAVRVRAGLELLKHAARARDAVRAREVVDLLLARLPPAPESQPPPAARAGPRAPAGWESLLHALRADAVRAGPGEVALVAAWLGEIRLGAEALAWLDTLPAAIRRAAPVLRVAAALSVAAEDMDRLQTLLVAGALGPLPSDAVRLALAARLQATLYQKPHARDTWDDALAACRQNPAALAALAELASLWRDHEAAEKTLLVLRQLRPRAPWVYTALRNLHAARGETAKLWQLHGSWLLVRPADTQAARAWLSLGAVLDRPSPEAVALARQRAGAPDAEPVDQAILAGLAWRTRQLPAALKLLERLPPEALARPDIAFWAALVFAEAARPDEARRALAAARRPGLLAEESALLNQAERSLGPAGGE